MRQGLIFGQSTAKIDKISSKTNILNLIRSIRKIPFVSFAITKIKKEISVYVSIGRFLQNNEGAKDILKREEETLRNALLSQDISFEITEKEYLRHLNIAESNGKQIETGILKGIPTNDRELFFTEEIYNLILDMKSDVILIFNATSISDAMLDNQKRSILENRQTNYMLRQIDPNYHTFYNRCNHNLRRLAKGETKGYWHAKPIILTITNTDSIEEISVLGRTMKAALSSLSEPQFLRTQYKTYRHEVFNGYIKNFNDASMINSEEFSNMINFPVFLEKKSSAIFEIPSREKAEGDLGIGTVMLKDEMLYPFYIWKKDLLKNMLICGSVGSGKTNLSYVLMRQLAHQNTPFILFDMKRNGREFFQEDRDTLIFRVGRDNSAFFNPLIPPEGVDPKEYVELITNIIDEAFFLGHGAHTVTMDLIDSCFEAFGVYEGKKTFPTLKHLRAYFEIFKKKYSGWRERQWCESVGRVLQVTTFGKTGKIFQNQNSNLKKLLGKKIVFEMDRLSEDICKFFVQSILLYIRHMNLTSNEREKLNLVLFFEEAHNYFKRKNDDKETILEKTLRELRELNCGCVIIDQMPSKLSRVTIANTNTKICLNLPDHIDRFDMKKSLGLDDEQTKFMGNLSTGQGILKRQAGFTSPFVVQTPEFILSSGEKLKKGIVTSEEIDKVMQPKLSEFNIVKIEDDTLTTPENFDKAITELKDKYSKGKKRKDIEPELLVLLQIVNDYPGLNTTQTYEKAGLSGSKGHRLKSLLIKRELIKTIEINREKGGKEKRIEITSKGKEFLGKDPLPKRLGGPATLATKRKIEGKLQNEGYEVEQEVAIGGGHAIDLVAKKGGETLLIEIATGKSNELTNLQKIKDHFVHFTKIYFVCVNEKALTKVEAQFRKRDTPEPLVKLVTLSDFLYRR